MAEIGPLLRTDVKPVDKREPLSSVQGWLMGQSSRLPIVTDGNRPYGILNERALMGTRKDLHARIQRYTLATLALAPTATTDDARARLAEHRAAYVPVEDESGGLAGYVRALDVARETLRDATARSLAVPVLFLARSATVGDALHAFAKEYVEFLPVLEGRALFGVLPRSAILRIEFHATDKGRKDAGGEKPPLLREPIAGFVDTAPAIVGPEASAEQLLDVLGDAGYSLVGTRDSILGIATPETILRPGGR